MDTVSFFRIIKTGVLNFWRNIWLSLAATLVMVITLVILSTLLMLFGITNYSVKTIKERVDISAYFKTGVAESRVQEITTELKRNPKVKEVTYTSATEALEQFKAKHADDPLIMQSISELTENPLPATIQIKAVDLESYPEIAESLQSDNYRTVINKVNFEDNRLLIERLGKLLRFIVTAGLGLAIVFIIIAVLVIFNTITLTIYNRREEVEIMRLVGATNSYIRGPFLVESLLYSCAATGITALLLVPIFTNLVPQVDRYLGATGSVFQQTYFSLPYIITMQLIIAILLSAFSSSLAIRRYLKI